MNHPEDSTYEENIKFIPKILSHRYVVMTLSWRHQKRRYHASPVEKIQQYFV